MVLRLIGSQILTAQIIAGMAVNLKGGDFSEKEEIEQKEEVSRSISALCGTLRRAAFCLFLFC